MNSELCYRRLIWGVAVILVLAGWLWNGTEWTLRGLAGKEDFLLCPAKPVNLPRIQDFAMDRMEANPETRLQMVTVAGWLLPPPAWRQTGAPPTRCDVIFKGDGIWYRVATRNLDRRDVRDIFHVEGTQVMAGFRTHFSPVAMQKGSYRMGLVACAGTNDLALVWTAQKWIQDRKGFRKLDGK